MNCEPPLHEGINDQIAGFEARFFELMKDFKKEVSKRGDLRTLQSSVTYLPLTVRRDHYEFIEKASADLDHAGNIEDFFRHLNLYWSFLEYSLLDFIIERNSGICSDKLKREMQRFKRDVEDFKKSTTVKEFWDSGSVCGDSIEPPPGFKRIVTTLDRHAFECTLAELDQFRRSFCHKLNLRTFILKLVAFQKGSFTAIWHIPSSQVHRIILAFSSTLVTIDELLYLEVDEWTWSCTIGGKLTWTEVCMS